MKRPRDDDDLPAPETLDDRLLALVCRKCFARADEREGKLGKRLTKAVRRRLDERRVRVADTGCLGLCPAGGITVVLMSEQSGGPTVARVVPAAGGEAAVVALIAGGEREPG